MKLVAIVTYELEAEEEDRFLSEPEQLSLLLQEGEVVDTDVFVTA